MYSLPRSLLLLPITGLVFLLQLFPPTGVALMLFAAPLWSIVLVNAAFLGVIVEVFFKAVPKYWLILPLGWFGGYGFVAAQDHLTLARIRREVAVHNASVHIPVDTNRMALVFSKDSASGWYVKNYAVPVVYVSSPNLQGAQHASFRLATKPVCEQVRKEPAFRQASIYMTWVQEDTDRGYGGRWDTNLCVIRQPEDPSLPAATVTEEERTETLDGMPVHRMLSIIELPDGRKTVVRGGYAAPLPWLPQPIMGCALNSSAASWDCVAQFGRSGFTPLVTVGRRFRSNQTALMAALGIRHIGPKDRRAASSRKLEALLRQSSDRAVAADLAELAPMLADPGGNNHWGHFNALKGRPDVLAQWDKRIVEGFERAYDDPVNTKESGRSLADLVATLPDDSWQRLGPRMMSLYQRTNWHWIRERSGLLARLGDLGPSSLPLLKEALSSPREAGGAIAGLCRLGAPAARHFGKEFLDRLGDNQLQRNEAEPYFIALVRMGLRIQALEVNRRREWPVHPVTIKRIGTSPTRQECRSQG